MIIDAHAHLWGKQNGRVNSGSVYDIGGGRSMFGGEIRQMMPPYLTDGINSAERLIANMDYAGVSGAVITQEYIDGNQNDYLLQCKEKYPDRLKVCALYEEKPLPDISGFDGIKICASRLADPDLLKHIAPFEAAMENGKFISIDLADGDGQTDMLQKIINRFPDLRITSVTSAWSQERAGSVRFVWRKTKTSSSRAAASHGYSTRSSIPIPLLSGRSGKRQIWLDLKS